MKPLDEEGVISNARECGGKIVTVEDHYPEVRERERHDRQLC